jgi:glucokinase
MIGVELRDGAVVAVRVGDDGTVQERTEANTVRELRAAAADALTRLAARPGEQIGVAAIAPQAEATVAAIDALGRPDAKAATVLLSGTAAAVAEAWIGAARNGRDIVYFSIADHATAGIVHDGAPVVGAHRRAAAVAWLALNPVEREDYRKIGCLEAEVAAAGLVRRLVWRIKAGDQSRAQEMANGDLASVTLEHVLDAARQNDGVAFSVVRDTAKYLGMAAANLVAVTDPDTLVLGGVMASAADLFLEPVRVEIGRRLPGSMVHALTIAPAILGGDAAAIGAARFAAFAAR